MILAGDIGGTKTVMGIFVESGSTLKPAHEAEYRNTDFESFDAVLETFIVAAGRPHLTAACFGVAGPIIEDRVEMLNLDWTMDAAALGSRLEIRHVRLLNDLEAAAYGMLHLRPDEFYELSPGMVPRRRGNVGLIAAGTGLGESLLCWDGAKYQPVASEGGHADFAPRNEVEIELLRYLQGTVGDHVSYERVLSGPGLVNIYQFLRDTGRAEDPEALRARLGQGDPAATISTCALAGEFPICTQALEIFVSAYGAEAGNLALRGLTFAGLYVGGGIAPKIVAKLADGAFMRSFCAKGRRSELASQVPVAVALNSKAAKIGAAHFARQLQATG
jgi:glucokinase